MNNEPSRRPAGKHIPVPFWLGAILKLTLFLLIPAAVTAALSMSRLTLTHQDGASHARVERLIFFTIPWRTETLTGVAGADFKTITGYGTKRRTSSSGSRSDYTKTENGVLTLTSPAGELKVETAPSIGPEKREAIAAFIADSSLPPQQHFIMGHRLFGWLFGIPVTLLAALYVVGCALELCHRLFGFPKRPKPWTGQA